MDDPAGPVPDTSSFLPVDRDASRIKHLNVVEGAFARGREKRAESPVTERQLRPSCCKRPGEGNPNWKWWSGPEALPGKSP